MGGPGDSGLCLVCDQRVCNLVTKPLVGANLGLANGERMLLFSGALLCRKQAGGPPVGCVGNGLRISRDLFIAVPWDGAG